MPRSILERIRELVRLGEYNMSSHAMEEMAEDGLDIVDIEETILDGQIARTEEDDPRSTKYTVEGWRLTRQSWSGSWDGSPPRDDI